MVLSASAEPLESLADGFAPGVAGHHVSVLPPALALDRGVGRPGCQHPACHTSMAAVSAKPVAQAGGTCCSAHPAGQGIPGQPEHRSSGVGVSGPDRTEFPGGGRGDCHRCPASSVYTDMASAILAGSSPVPVIYSYSGLLREL